MTKLEIGDKAPAIGLKDQDGETVRLSSFKGRKVLVFFYPKANTPGCTNQACGLRDVADQVGDTAIVGISPDMPDKQAAFDQKYSLGYPLLSDADKSVARQYGVSRRIGILPNQRATFAIGADGVIVAAVHSEINMNVHADAALKALAKS